MEGQHQGMDGPVDVIIALHCRGQASMGGHHSGSICRSTPTTPGRQGFWLIVSCLWLHFSSPLSLLNNLCSSAECTRTFSFPSRIVLRPRIQISPGAQVGQPSHSLYVKDKVISSIPWEQQRYNGDREEISTTVTSAALIPQFVGFSCFVTVDLRSNDLHCKMHLQFCFMW